MPAESFRCRFEFDPDNRTVVVELHGKFDPVAVEELHPQVQEVLRAGVRRFVFDLSGLTFAGSLGLRLLVGLATRVKGEGAVALCAPPPAVRTMLETTKLAKVLPVHATREEARRTIGEPGPQGPG